MSAATPLAPDQRRFIAGARTAVLATIAPHGGPRLVPICFVVVDTAEGVAVDSPLDDKPKSVREVRDLARVRDILARPSVALLVDRWSEDWSRLAWLRIEGSARLVEPSEAGHADVVAALRAKYPQYVSHRLDDRPLLRVSVVAATSWGDLAAR